MIMENFVKVTEAFNRYYFVHCEMSLAAFMAAVKRHGVMVRILRES